MKKILVAEDDKVLLNLMRDQLASNGYEVLGVSNGKDGLDLALKTHPDLLLIDIMMPIMTGMEMTAELRKDEWGKNAKIVVLTNLNNDETVADFLEKGAFDYLLKSDWAIEDVVKMVKNKLGDKA
ncbi:MAG: response regulator [Candidatus Staskawiczbacteria bacterium]|nr:response regulator [Candidatus Staskawiczbacteria bacterium]